VHAVQVQGDPSPDRNRLFLRRYPDGIQSNKEPFPSGQVLFRQTNDTGEGAGNTPLNVVEDVVLIPFNSLAVMRHRGLPTQCSIGRPYFPTRAKVSLSPSKGDFCGSGPENPLEIALRHAQGDSSLDERKAGC